MVEVTASFCSNLAEKARRDPGLPVPNPTTSAWQSVPHELANHQSPALPSNTSVAIIGSGMTGISTAYHLLRHSPGLNVTVLEARSLTSGATGRNGGHCKEVPYVNYPELKSLVGKDGAIKIARFRLAQLDALFETAAALPGVMEESQLRRVEGVDLYYDRAVFEEMKAKRESYLEDFPEERDRWLVWEGKDLEEKFDAANAVGCMTGPAGALWPYRFVGGVTTALFNKDQYPNFDLETNTPVESIWISGPKEYPYEIKTSRGSIFAQHVVHCTNRHAGHLLPGLRGPLYPLRGQMTVQSRPSSFPNVGDKRSWILHYAPGYEYITQSPLPSGNIYLGGGLRQALTEPEIEESNIDVGNIRDDQHNTAALRYIEKTMERGFRNGKGSEILKKWTGIMAYTIDDVPIIGKVPSSISDRKLESGSGAEWIGAGFCGHGMAYCWLTGRALAEMVLKGEENVGDWFPRKELACSEERLRRIGLEDAISSFLKTVA
ncbi:conserved hypothetical protein [Paecilomyces variotii No. 5]|uniref:FAD dependent oxidoreductase domain-containing protein n=1 Tax=Byssochlamys spectabilis (strain No. 5 / NBRC 109023) TaxID=1356009 RepID=V5FTI9_BYSSN|nr:conserved hypothetical protein [Paecilomyces variotii No. 5]